MQVIPQPQALHVVGITLLTTTAKPSRPSRRTGPPSAGRSLPPTHLPHRLSDGVHAVYTNVENAGSDNGGRCTLVIGHAVPGHWTRLPPEELTHMVAPASLRAEFPVEKARLDPVGAEWVAIWQRANLKMIALADHPRHQPDGSIHIHIHIGIFGSHHDRKN